MTVERQYNAIFSSSLKTVQIFQYKNPKKQKRGFTGIYMDCREFLLINNTELYKWIPSL
jgi:hypothetical protein